MNLTFGDLKQMRPNYYQDITVSACLSTIHNKKEDMVIITTRNNGNNLQADISKLYVYLNQPLWETKKKPEENPQVISSQEKQSTTSDFPL